MDLLHHIGIKLSAPTHDLRSWTTSAHNAGRATEKFERTTHNLANTMETGAVKGFQRFTHGASLARKEAERFRRTLIGLSRIALTLGGFLGLRQLVEYADTWRLINARIKVVTDTTEEAMAVQQKVYEIANRTRSSLSATTVLYQRMALNIDQLGRSQNELLAVVEAVNNAMLISGATGVEAAQSIRQLGQALGAGRLQGDEFRTVMEAMPVVARAIADEMGVPVGLLKDLASEGKLAVDVIIDAMLNRSEELAERSKSMPITIGQSFQIFVNSLTRIVGIMNEAEGVADVLGSRIRWMADNMEKVVAAVGAAISALIAYKVAVTAAAVASYLMTAPKMIIAWWNAVRAMKAMADWAHILGTGLRGVAGVLGALAAVGVGLVAYKLLVKEITEASEKWLAAQGNLDEIKGVFTVPLDKEAQKQSWKSIDMIREAHQKLAIAAEQDEIAQKKLEIAYDALNQRIEASRELTGKLLTERLRAIRIASSLAVLEVEAEAAVSEYTDALKERMQIVSRFIKDLQRSLADTFEKILMDGIANFQDFAKAVKQIFFRLIAELASAQFIGRLQGALESLVRGLVGQTKRIAEAQAALIAIQAGTNASRNQGFQDLEFAGSLTVEESVRRLFARPGGVTGGIGVYSDKMREELTIMQYPDDSTTKAWAETAGRYMGPILAGFITGRLVGGMTTNRLVGTIGGAASGAATGALYGSIVPGVGTAVGAIAGGLAGAIGGLWGAISKGNEEAKKLAEAMRQQALMLARNTLALEELKRSFDVEGISRLVDALAAVDLVKDLGFLGGWWKGLLDPKKLSADTLTRLTDIAQQMGIEIFDENGKIVGDALLQLNEAIQETIRQMTTFGFNLEDFTKRQELFNALFGFAGDTVKQAQDAYDVFRTFAPDLAKMLGLDTLDVTTKEGRELLRQGFRTIYDMLVGGYFQDHPELLGAFANKDELIDVILNTVNAFKSLDEELLRVTTDFPRAMDIIYYEQLFGKYGTGVDRSERYTWEPGGGTGSGSATRTSWEGGGFYIGEVTINNYSDQITGEEILEMIELEAKRKRARGGRSEIGDRESF